MEILDHFYSCDLDLDPMTFIYKLDPYPLEIYEMCKHELPTSRLSKVVTLQPANVLSLFFFLCTIRTSCIINKINECVHLVMHGHFRSRDKDGSHTTRSAIVENPTLHTKFMALMLYVLYNRKYCRSKFYIGNRDIRAFLLLCKYELPTLRLSNLNMYMQFTKSISKTTEHSHFYTHLIKIQVEKYCSLKIT